MSTQHLSPDPCAPEPSDLPDAPWRGFNDFGVMLALDGHWEDAHHAFTDALGAAPALEDAPDVHAILRSNIAQACFHTGDMRGAICSARASLEARLQCSDADDAPTARARADLAVYLAAAGALDEAQATLQEALRALEEKLGADDPRLTVLRVNAARLARLAEETPSTVAPPAVAEEAVEIFPTPSANAMDDYALDLVDELPPREAPPFTSPTPTQPAATDTDASTAVVSASPQAVAPPVNGLGFVVEYGVPQDLLVDGPPR